VAEAVESSVESSVELVDILALGRRVGHTPSGGPVARFHPRLGGHPRPARDGASTEHLGSPLIVSLDRPKVWPAERWAGDLRAMMAGLASIRLRAAEGGVLFRLYAEGTSS
jgi:hypothetical protein